MSKTERLDIIFNLLSSGVPSARIIDQVVQDKTNSQPDIELGIKSEKTVVKVLEDLRGVVTTVKRASKEKRYDQNGIDVLAETDIPFVGTLKVQVKSSTVGIAYAREKIQKSQNLSTRAELDSWLREHRTVLLNGRLTEPTIAKSFKAQVLEIYLHKAAFHRQEPNPKIIEKLS